MRALPTCFLLLLAGCERAFDQRYSDVEAQVKTEAEKLDRDLQRENAKQTNKKEVDPG